MPVEFAKELEITVASREAKFEEFLSNIMRQKYIWSIYDPPEIVREKMHLKSEFIPDIKIRNWQTRTY